MSSAVSGYDGRGENENTKQGGSGYGGRHELHGDDAEAQSRHGEIDLLAALPHSSRSGSDRERTPGRGPFKPRPRRGIGDAFSRSLGLDSQVVQEGDVTPRAVRSQTPGTD